MSIYSNKYLQRVEKTLHAGVKLAIGSSNLIILLSLLSFVFFGFNATRVRQAITYEEQLDPDLASTLHLKNEKRDFHEGSSLGIVIFPRGEHFGSFELCDIQKSVNDIAFFNSEITSFFSPAKIRKATYLNEKLSYYRDMPELCNGTEDFQVKLPTTPWTGIVTDSDFKDFAVNYSIRDPDEPGKFGFFRPEVIEKLMSDISTKLRTKVIYFGSAAQSIFMQKGMEQAQFVNLLVVLILFSSLRLIFGTWKSGIVYLTTLIFTITVVYGLMGLIGFSVDLLSTCVFLLLAVACLEDFIFISYHHLHSKRSLTDSFTDVIVPCFFTSFTTMLGFASLCWSDLQSIRHLGLMTAVGSMVEWACMFWIIPAFMQKWPRLQNLVRPEKIVIRSIESTMKVRIPKKWMYLSLGVFALAVYSTFRWCL